MLLCQVFGANNVEFITKTRTEHLTEEDKKRARKLVDKAHELHEEFLFEAAAETYKRALEHWAHPAIHLSLANLYSKNRPLDAHAHLLEAVRFGPEALHPESVSASCPH